MKKGYKVVYNFQGSLESVTWFFTEFGVVYGPGGVVKPRHGCGPLCVFGELDDALAFVARLSPRGVELWECEYEPSARDEVWTPVDAPEPVDEQPPGTVLASAVKLTRRIK